MNILVTGGTGFIGSALVRSLVSLGSKDDVFVLSPDADFSRLGKAREDVQIVEGNILDPDSYRSQVKKIDPDIVYHLAWYAEPGKYLSGAENLEHLKHGIDFLKFLNDLGGCKVIAAGTCFEYDTSYGFLSESTPEKPEHLYSACKLALKKVGEQISLLQGSPFIWARIFYLYGPYEHPARLVPRVMDSLCGDRKFRLRTHGLQVRDYMHVDDVASGLRLLAKEKKTSTYNIGSGYPVRVRDLVMKIGEMLGKKDLISFASETTPLDEPLFICADNAKLKSLGFREEQTLEKYLSTRISEASE